MTNVALTGLARDLAKRAAEGKPVRIGVIGSGEMGTDLVTQGMLMPGIEVCAISTRRPHTARDAIRIAYGDEAMAVEAWVADIAGRRIAVLAAGETWPAGTRELRWDGRDASGRAVRAGVYTLHVRAGAWSAVRSIVRLR